MVSSRYKDITDKTKAIMIDLIILGAQVPTIIRIIDDINQNRKRINIVGFIDNDPSKHNRSFMGHKVLGSYKILEQPAFRRCKVINAISRDCPTRKETTEQLIEVGASFVNIVHPSVNLKYVSMGIGNLIHEGVLIQPNVVLGNHCVLSVHAGVGHESQIGDYVFMGPKSYVGGLVSLKEGAYVGMSASVLPRKAVGPWSIVGAGATVIEDVPGHVTVVGTPARVIRKHNYSKE